VKDRPVPTLVSAIFLAVTLVVLGSHIFFVVGLVDSGVTWRDGPRAYGVAGGDLPADLPEWIARLSGLVMVLAVLLGPLLVLVGLGAAVDSVWTSWRQRCRVDVLAASTVVLALALLVLLVTWGDELWVWMLD